MEKYLGNVMVNVIGIFMVLCSAMVIRVDAAGERSVSIDSVKSLRALSEPKEITLKQNQLYVIDRDGKASKRKTIVQASEYECTLVDRPSDSTKERKRNLMCYEMQVEGANSNDVRTIWTSRPVKGLALFGHDQGENYLAWVDGGAVYFEEVSEAKSKETSLSEFVAKDPQRFVVPVEDLVGREPFVGLDALHSNIEVLRVDKAKSGSLRVTVRGSLTEKPFMFVLEDGVWKLLQ